MRTALYARYSTEMQSAASIPDQLRVCERLAERHGFTVVERFSDAAISGGTVERPGYQDMLRAARAKRVDVIVAEDTSRLWRNLAEQAPRLAELADLGVHVVTHDLDTRQESAAILGAVLGASSEAYRREIGRRTRRGLEGRARDGKSAGGRAFGYISQTESPTKQREVHPEQAATVVRIFDWYAAGKSPRWIAGQLNAEGVPSPGASWRRTSERLNAKRKRGWVPSAIHGDEKRGTGILNNPMYCGRIVWGRSTWKRSAADSSNRTWSMNSTTELVTHQDERLRIIPQALWDAVKARQKDIARGTVLLRTTVKRAGRLPRHLLSGLLKCELCGGTIRAVNGREFGCASHKDGGAAACTNSVRIRFDIAEARLLTRLTDELLSPEAIALLERRIRDHVREHVPAPRTAPKAKSQAIARKETELEQLRELARKGTLSPAVADAAVKQAEAELQALSRANPAGDEKASARVLRMLPKAAGALRERISGGNAGLKDPRSIAQGRGLLFSAFGGKVPLRPAQTGPGERPYMIARVGLNRNLLIEAAASAAGCLEFGSGGRI